MKLDQTSRPTLAKTTERHEAAAASQGHRQFQQGCVSRAGKFRLQQRARQTSKNLHLGEVDRMIGDMRDINRGTARFAGRQCSCAVRQQPGRGGRLRFAACCSQYLGGSIGGHVGQHDAALQVTLPWLSQYSGISRPPAR